MTSRRTFLACGCRSIGALSLGGGLSRLGMMNALAQTSGGPDYKALVCVFLFGGNDANNTVVPISSQYSQYAAVRGSLAIPQAQLLSVSTPSGAVYGLHPALAPLHPLWAQQRLAIVANVGMLIRPMTRQDYLSGRVPVPNNLFSHSDQTAQWQTGIPTGGTTGWGGRIADRLTAYGVNAPSSFPLGTSVNGGALLLNGQATKPATVIPGQTSTGLEGTNPNNQAMVARDQALQEILSFDSGFALVQAASATTREGIRIAQLISSATQNNPLTTQFPQSSLGNQMAQIARLIQIRDSLGMRRQIFFCGLGGFDTHSNQLGTHQALLADLSASMAAFYNAMSELGVLDKVTVFTESEFSRTFQPSQGAGTDHAWGGHHLVMGAAVRGGQLYGTFPVLALQGPDDSGNRGNWIPTTSLDQYGATLAAWFGVPAVDLPTIFPNLANFPTQNLGFMF